MVRKNRDTCCEKRKLVFIDIVLSVATRWFYALLSGLKFPKHTINQAQSFVTCSNSFTSSSFLCSRLAFAVFNFSTSSISCEEKDSKSNKGLDIRENCSANSMTKFQCTFFKSLSSFSFSVTSLAVFPWLLPPREDWVFSLTFAFSNSCWYSRQKNAFKLRCRARKVDN